MGENFAGVAEEVQPHIKNLVKTAGLPDTEESLELLAGGWLGKQNTFFEETKKRNMEEAESFDADDPRGALILTYSGSLLTVGPEQDEGRTVEYVSIGLRHDVPETASSEGASLVGDIRKGAAAEFNDGPISKSSPVYAIAVFREVMEAEEEENRLGEMTLMLTKEFLDINKTVIHS